jgi:hypothetical protein
VPDSHDPNRRLTNAERREQARRKREEIQRAMAKKRRTRLWGGVALALAVALIVTLVVVQPFGGNDPQVQAEELLARAPAASTTAGCTEVETIGPYEDAPGAPATTPADQTHIGAEQFPTQPELSTYPSSPPTSGPHDADPLPAGIYSTPPDIYRTLHSLEHGATIIWYDPTTSGPALDELKAFYDRKVASASVGQDRVIIAPFDYPGNGDAGQLGDGVQMALVAWHRMQTCSSVSLPVAFAFTSTYSAPPSAGQPYAGEAPEAGGAM